MIATLAQMARIIWLAREAADMTATAFEAREGLGVQGLRQANAGIAQVIGRFQAEAIAAGVGPLKWSGVAAAA